MRLGHEVRDDSALYDTVLWTVSPKPLTSEYSLTAEDALSPEAKL